MSQTKVCAHCGERFERASNRNDAQWAAQRHCNTRCAGAARRERRRQTTPPLTCKVCGLAFWTGVENRSRNHCGAPECREAYLAETGRRISERHKADYASGKRRPGIGLSRRETALWPLLAPHGWVWNLYWVDADAIFQLDFADMERKLNVEIDGVEHREPRNRPRDQSRDAELERRGWRILRIPNEDVDASPQAVADRIAAWAEVARVG